MTTRDLLASPRCAEFARRVGGTALATGPPHMAAVLCLMFLPISLAVLFLVGSLGSITFGTGLAGAMFVVLCGGIVIGAMNMSREWDEAA